MSLKRSLQYLVAASLLAVISFAPTFAHADACAASHNPWPGTVWDPENCNTLKPNSDGSINVTGTINASTTAKATAAAPTYVEGTTNPLSMDLSGAMRITGSISATSAATATAAAPSYTEGASSAISQNLTGDARVIAKQSGTWNIGTVTTITNPVAATQSGTWNVTNVSGTVSLPTGAATAAKQPALGTAGAASTDVITVQGIASGTPQPVSGTVTAAQATASSLNATVVQATGSNLHVAVDSAPTTTVSGTVAATQSGTWTVQPGNTANTTAWKVDGSAVTQPVSMATNTPTLQSGSTTAVTQATAGNLNATVVGTGTFTTQAAQSGTWTVQPGNTANTTAWKVDGSAVTQPVSLASVPSHAVTNAGTFAVQSAATQTGTWTVQPGNTQNTTPWLTRQSDGTSNQAIKAASTSAALTDPAAVMAISPNPAPVCTSRVAITQITSTDLVTMTNIGYICSIVLVSDTAQFVALTEGTGTLCATGAAALLGSTTVGSGLSLSANGGFTTISGIPWLKMVASGDHLCLLQSGVGRIGGVITYQDHS